LKYHELLLENAVYLSNLLKSYELSVKTIFEICTQVTWWKGKTIKKSTPWGARRTINWFP